LTVLEALASATPVIVGDGNAGRESVVDGETGLWFRHNDAAELAAQLRRMQDDALVARLSNAAHARYWAQPFTLERHAARLEEVYAGLLAEAGSAGKSEAGRIAARR
jgi:glycosyltransferase involved in cell wall biosynthesis